MFKQNFSWDMSKLYYFMDTNFQKSPSAVDSPPTTPINFRYWWSEVAWL